MSDKPPPACPIKTCPDCEQEFSGWIAVPEHRCPKKHYLPLKPLGIKIIIILILFLAMTIGYGQGFITRNLVWNAMAREFDDVHSHMVIIQEYMKIHEQAPVIQEISLIIVKEIDNAIDSTERLLSHQKQLREEIINNPAPQSKWKLATYPVRKGTK